MLYEMLVAINGKRKSIVAAAGREADYQTNPSSGCVFSRLEFIIPCVCSRYNITFSLSRARTFTARLLSSRPFACVAEDSLNNNEEATPRFHFHLTARRRCSPAGSYRITTGILRRKTVGHITNGCGHHLVFVFLLFSCNYILR